MFSMQTGRWGDFFFIRLNQVVVWTVIGLESLPETVGAFRLDPRMLNIGSFFQKLTS